MHINKALLSDKEINTLANALNTTFSDKTDTTYTSNEDLIATYLETQRLTVSARYHSRNQG